VDKPFHFDGFRLPHYTQIPDEAFDYLMPRLSPAEWKVLCYIMRRTFGFQKPSDDISLKQMVEGIRTKDGTMLDEGTGLSRPTVTTAIRGLVEKGVVVAQRNRSMEKGDEPTTYQLHIVDPS
jgi:DNA-binding MarR family transcriptional regulator